MKKLYLIALLGLLWAGCGDNVVDLPKNGKAYLRVSLGCSNGITVYSIEGDSYVEGESREQSVDAMGGKGVRFTVVPNTEYTIRANNSIREGELLGSVTATSPPADENSIGISSKNLIDVEIPCD